MLSINLIPDKCLRCLAECAPQCDKLSDQERRDFLALLEDTQFYRQTGCPFIRPREKPKG